MAVVISDRLLEGSDRLLDAEPDDQLVSLVQTGHEAAFAAIVRRYERELQAHAHRLSSDGRAEDAVQQAFLNAFAALRAGGEVRHLRGWLHQILRNEVTRARAPVDAPLEATVASGETLEDTVARRATAHAALRELSALPDRQRDALLGTAVLGFPRAHVARTMGLSEGAVRQLVHRARLRLRQAASGLIPFPLVRLFGAARSGVDAAPDAALGAGTAVSAAASGGLAVKVGALLASGILATGIAVTHSGTSHHRHGAPAGHRAGSPARSARHLSPASAGPAVISDHLGGRDHGALTSSGAKRVHGGPGRLSENRPGRHRGSGSGRDRAGGRGHDGPPAARGDDGSGRSSGGTSGRGGGVGSSGSSGSSTGSRSGSGSGDETGGSGRGQSGSGSNGGRQEGSGSGSGSVTGTATSGSDSGAGSSDGGGSGRSSSGGGATSSSDDDTSVSEPSGSSGSTSSGSDTGAQSSGSGASSQAGSDQANVASLGSDGAQATDSGSGSGSGKENSPGARDLSGATHSSSS